MNKFLATMLQTIQNYAPPPPVDNGSIWQHMSEALRQSLFRVLSLLIAVLPDLIGLVMRVPDFEEPAPQLLLEVQAVLP